MVKISKSYIPKDKEKYMCAKHLAFFKQKLLDWKNELKKSSSEALYNLAPDAVIIFAWNFNDSIIDKPINCYR